MRIAINIPMGALGPESGLIVLLGNYLRSQGHEVLQLRCDGTCSVCDRDGEQNWKRSIEACPSCMRDQDALARWGQIQLVGLSRYLTAEDVNDSYRWIMSAPATSLATLRFDGRDLFELCREAFRIRTALSAFDPTSSEQSKILRQLMLAFVQSSLATRRFYLRERPDYSLVGGGLELISRAFMLESRSSAVNAALFQWQVNQRCIMVTHPESGATYSCNMFFHDLSSMRQDPLTWPKDVTQAAQEIFSFLGLSQQTITEQIPLLQAR